MSFGPLKAFYFLHYASVATFLSFFPAYLRGLGFSGEQIGAALVPAQIALAPAALLWGAVGDRFLTRPGALQICTLGAAAAFGAVPFARTPAEVGALLFVNALFAAGTVPLVDSITMDAASRASASYARTRLFGSIGFILTAQSLGLALSARGDLPADKLVPLAGFACIAGTAAVAALIRLRTAQVMEISPASSKAHLRDALTLLRGPLPVVLAFCAVHWMALGPYHLLFGVLVRDRGLGAELTGLGMAIGVIAEVGALFAFPRVSARIPLRGLFAIAFAASALRWLGVWRATTAAELVALQALHGLTFGLWWGASVQAMGQLVPAPLRATGQALFSAVVFGAGNAVGYALAGAGYDRFGAAGTFAVAGVMEAVNALAVLALGGWLTEKAAVAVDHGQSLGR